MLSISAVTFARAASTAGKWVITALTERSDILGMASSSSVSLSELNASSLVRSVGASTKASAETEKKNSEGSKVVAYKFQQYSEQP